MEQSLTNQLLGQEFAVDDKPQLQPPRMPTRLSKLLTTNKAAASSTPQAPRSIPTEKKRQIRWLQLDQNGGKSFMSADKRMLVQVRNLRMPVRDLRVLDKAFMMEASSNLLVRERCIIVSMEHVRIIVTPDAVYAPIDADCSESEAKFLHRLEAQALLYGLSYGSMDPAACRQGDERAVSSNGARPAAPMPILQAHPEEGAVAVPIDIPSAMPSAGGTPESQPLLAQDQLPSSSNVPSHGGAAAEHTDLHQLANHDEANGAGTIVERDIVPFETVMLEAALDEVCSVLASEAAALVERSYRSLDLLSKRMEVSSEDLQLIRALKHQHQKLRTRVDVVRIELEELLEDDKDLQKMCLSTRQELQEAAREARAGRGQAMQHHAHLDSFGHSPPSFSFRHSRERNDFLFGSGPARSSQGDSRTGSPGGPPDLGQIEEEAGETREGSEHSGRQSGLRSSAVSAIIAADMEEMENLIESYFTQIGATSFKLRTLGAYIEDTEDYINLDMDAARNRLIKLEIMLTAATFSLAFWAVVAGVLGENMKIYPESVTTSFFGYILVNVGMLLFCILVFGVIVVHARRRRLI